jgi:hypothetical protein
MATNALATPSRPIDDDPQAPPIPTVFVGDPDTGYGGKARFIDPSSFFGQVMQLQVMMLTHVVMPLRATAPSTERRTNQRGVRRHD